MVEKRLMSVDDLSEYTGLRKSTIYCWNSQKRLPVVKAGRRVFFDKRKIDALIEEGELGMGDFDTPQT